MSTSMLEQFSKFEDEQEEQNRYSLLMRFGRDILSEGFTALPNLLLDCYAELGITHCEFLLLMHLIQHKWSKSDPHPALGTIAQKMGLSLRAVQNHVQSLRHKAFRCPHQQYGDEESAGCSCPKYLHVSHRYKPGVGQTSSSYNMSGLFAAVITLAREKGLLQTAEDGAEKCTGPRAESCTGGMKKPAYESEASKKNQCEKDESLSNSLKEEVEVTDAACSHREHGALRSLEDSSSREGQQKNRHKIPGPQPSPTHSSRNTTLPLSHAHQPPPASRAELSNAEPPPVKEMGRPRQSLFRKDEVKREIPRMSGPPLTKEQIDARLQEGKNASGISPLRTTLNRIIPAEHQDILAHQFGGDKRQHEGHFKYKPMPVYPRLQQAMESVSERLGDFHHIKSNITNADNIRRAAEVPVERLLEVLDEAYYATHTAYQKGLITKRDEAGRLVRMPYFFECVRQKLGLPPKALRTVDNT